MTSYASLTGAMSRRFLFPLLSFTLLFGAVSGAALTCFDDISIEDDVIEVEAVIDGNVNPSLSLSAVHSRLSSPWQGPRSLQIQAAGVDANQVPSALESSLVVILRI